MNCPPDVAPELAEILKWGLLRIRIAGQQGDGRRCAQESDHIHNLPGLIVDYAPQLLAYYWRIERPILIKQVGEGECKMFEEPWARLKLLVERECQGCDLAGPPTREAASEQMATIT